MKFHVGEKSRVSLGWTWQAASIEPQHSFLTQLARQTMEVSHQEADTKEKKAAWAACMGGSGLSYLGGSRTQECLPWGAALGKVPPRGTDSRKACQRSLLGHKQWLVQSCFREGTGGAMGPEHQAELGCGLLQVGTRHLEQWQWKQTPGE